MITVLLHGSQAAFCGRVPHELGKERVAIFLSLHGPFSGEQKAGWADARRVENGRISFQFDWNEFQQPPFRVFHVKRLGHLAVSQPPEVGARLIVRTTRAGV
jgi:hypothetical protein